jgi:hypothetical protein
MQICAHMTAVDRFLELKRYRYNVEVYFNCTYITKDLMPIFIIKSGSRPGQDPRHPFSFVYEEK